MATASEHRPVRDVTPAQMFADLRRRNEYAAQVSRMLDGKRKRRIDQAIRVQHMQRRQGR